MKEQDPIPYPIIDTLPVGIIIADSLGKIVCSNRAAAALFGSAITGDAFELGGDYTLHRRDGTLFPRDELPLSRALEKGEETRDLEIRVRFEDSSESAILASGSPLFDEGGTITGAVVVLQNITDRVLAEEVLSESEERFRTVFDESPLGMAIVDPDYRFSRVNIRLCRMLGYTEQELTALSFPDITHPGDLDKDLRLAESLFRGEIPYYTIEKRYFRKDGGILWISLTGTIVRDPNSGAPHYFIAMIEDISDRKTTERELEKERNFISAILNVAGALVIVLDPEGRIVRFNHACEATMGYTFGEVEGKPFWDIFIIPEEMEAVRNTFESIKAGDFPNSHENYWVAKSGERRLISWSDTALTRNGNTIEYIIGTGIDITDKRKLEAELLASATVDRLTGIMNRQAFENIMEVEIERARRYGRPLSLIMFDIDHFKTINDTYGHLFGDFVLKSIASLVKGNIRNADFLGRWGGEEFMVLAPETSLEEARAMAEKLRTLLEEYPFEKTGTTTASFGVTLFESTDTVDCMITRVDNALYVAKRRGRNRAEVAEVTPPE